MTPSDGRSCTLVSRIGGSEENRLRVINRDSRKGSFQRRRAFAIQHGLPLKLRPRASASEEFAAPRANAVLPSSRLRLGFSVRENGALFGTAVNRGAQPERRPKSLYSGEFGKQMKARGGSPANPKPRGWPAERQAACSRSTRLRGFLERKTAAPVRPPTRRRCVAGIPDLDPGRREMTRKFIVCGSTIKEGARSRDGATQSLH